jgi:hypothetical protein
VDGGSENEISLLYACVLQVVESLLCFLVIFRSWCPCPTVSFYGQFSVNLISSFLFLIQSKVRKS